MTGTIDIVSGSVAAFVGHTLAGPINRVVAVRSYLEYANSFGGLAASSEVSYAVLQFFRNGGEQALIVRVPEDDTGLPGLEALGGRERSYPVGLSCLESNDEFSLLCVPDVTRPREPGGSVPQFRIERMAEFWRTAMDLCRRKRAMLLVDLPANATTVLAARGALAALPRGTRALPGAYAPWLPREDPLHANRQRLCAPSGTIAGLYARIEKTRGAWKAPAGLEADLRNVRRLAAGFTDTDQSVLNPLALNLLREFPGRGLVCWGARTLDISGDWTHVPVRRLGNLIERSVLRGAGWVAGQGNGPGLWTRLRTAIETCLYGLFREGAFAGQKPESCYFVRCGPDTTTAADIASGQVRVEIGFAPLRPAEFLILRLALTTLPPSA